MCGGGPGVVRAIPDRRVRGDHRGISRCMLGSLPLHQGNMREGVRTEGGDISQEEEKDELRYGYRESAPESAHWQFSKMLQNLILLPLFSYPFIYIISFPYQPIYLTFLKSSPSVRLPDTLHANCNYI